MSTTLKRIKLELLKKLGKKYLLSKSPFNIEYIISLGDFFSQDTYYNPKSNCAEILTSIAWCYDIDKPIIFDIGAHCGYMTTHFAKLLETNQPQIFSFEPVIPTFIDLMLITKKLKINHLVNLIPAAISNKQEIVSLRYNKWESMLSQIKIENENQLIYDKNSCHAVSTTIDQIVSQYSRQPDLIKLDVEGFESNAIRGAKTLMQSNHKPALCIEWNPETLHQCGSSKEELAHLLGEYYFFYINDYEGKFINFLDIIDDITSISWVCNLFAIPKKSNKIDKWKYNITLLKNKYSIDL